MSDKEPRRRKKRKDGQRKDDIRADEQIFQPTKSESRDSDQEPEEEFVIPTHQPSKFAKLVFMLLFSGLVISMSFIFISLQGTERGPVDIFDGGHGEEHEEVSHDIHEETQSWSSSESFQESLGDILPGIGNILSLNDEQIKQTDDVILETVGLDSSENLELKETLEDEKIDIPSLDSAQEPEATTDQGIIEKYIEDIEETVLDVPTEDIIPPDVSTVSVEESPVTEEEEYISESVVDSSQSRAFTESSETAQETEYMSTFQPEDDDESDEYVSTTVPYSEESISTFTPMPEELQPSTEQSMFIEEPENEEDDGYTLYEKVDVTNKADYEIRDQLDEVDKILEKDISEDDDFDDDDDDDENEEQSQDEFDFWQF